MGAAVSAGLAAGPLNDTAWSVIGVTVRAWKSIPGWCGVCRRCWCPPLDWPDMCTWDIGFGDQDGDERYDEVNPYGYRDEDET
ncbi:hypothetical protein GCM10012275_61400 [Longimycelium tulufanense]|uniref:Uncharacterized protein n=1 Tax=Longimycelium tulufanense TaxID=907463 RepID=A0A8J3CEH2_9PSEU|nr:hypothetical protein GCM10012275_61400 [Longimycelium tulufanense]